MYLEAGEWQCLMCARQVNISPKGKVLKGEWSDPHPTKVGLGCEVFENCFDCPLPVCWEDLDKEEKCHVTNLLKSKSLDDVVTYLEGRK